MIPSPPAALTSMKIKPIVSLILTALLPGTLLAQSPSPIAPDTAIAPKPPIPPTSPRPPSPPRDARPKEPVTFLGVETSSVPPVVSEQLGLPQGFGLVVEHVVPGSPAAAAGFQENDIMRTLNDQQLVEPEQLAKLVRSFAEGTAVEFTLLRKGKETKVSAKLEKHDAPREHGPFGPGFDHLKFGQENEKMDFDFQLPDMSELHEAIDSAHKAARNIHIVTKDDGTVKATRIDLGRAVIDLTDGQGTMKLENLDGKKMLTVQDAQGRQIFKGPIDTKEQVSQLPPEVRERLEKLQHEDLPSIPPPPTPPHRESGEGDSTQAGAPGDARL
jgi:membrane-associated protease RseP (regulator of RpoE activity)